MGIKSLKKLLKSKCPLVLEEIHISQFSYKKIAIDTSLYLYRYKAAFGDDWLNAFVKLVCCLRENEVHCVFIYDSGCVEEKVLNARKKRAINKKNQCERVSKLEDALDNFQLSGEIDPILLEFSKKKSPKRLLNPDKHIFNIKAVEDEIESKKDKIITVLPEDFLKIKELFTILDIPYYNAPQEAETMAADLCKKGLVDAVLSEDTDLLAYGCPVFLLEINTYKSTCTQIIFSDVIKELKLDYPQFLDMCIMCGTDYNDNIPRIGPSKAYEKILESKSIDNLDFDTSVLNHKRSRDIFTNYIHSDVKRVPYCGRPNIKELEEFLTKNSVYVNIDEIRKVFNENNNIIFE